MMTSLRSPYLAHVRKIPGDYVTRTEAAAELGVSPWRLNNLRGRHGLKAPSKVTRIGSVSVYLYSRDDIAELRAFLDKGLKVFDTNNVTEADLKKTRSNLYQARRRWRQALDGATDPERVAECQKRLDGIAETLSEVNASLRALR